MSFSVSHRLRLRRQTALVCLSLGLTLSITLSLGFIIADAAAPISSEVAQAATTASCQTTGGQANGQEASLPSSTNTSDPNVIANQLFYNVWQRTDFPIASQKVSRSWYWGPKPLSGGTYEEYLDSPGGKRLVQYFDKSRMELNDPAKGYVTNGLLVVEMITGRLQKGDNSFIDRGKSNIAVAGDLDNSWPTYASLNPLYNKPNALKVGDQASSSWFPSGAGQQSAQYLTDATKIATIQNNMGIPAAFWNFLNRKGQVYKDGQYADETISDWLFSTGYPVTEAYWTKVRVGGVEKQVLFQAFERRVLTYTPDNAPEWQVEMGNVGLHYVTWRYNGSIPGAVPAVSGGGDQLQLDPTFEASERKRLQLRSTLLPKVSLDAKKVAVFGKVVSVKDDCLIVQIFEPFKGGKDIKILESQSLASLGLTTRTIAVTVNPGAYVQLKGDLASLAPNTPVIVGGSLSGNQMTANALGDLRLATAEPNAKSSGDPGTYRQLPPEALPPELRDNSVKADSTFKSNATYGPNRLDFKGGFGGPTFEYVANPDVTIFNLLGFKVSFKQFRFIAALDGWDFDFPFEFKADTPTLVAGQNGNISLSIAAKSPDGGRSSFFGGLGVNLAFTFGIHTPVGCGFLDLESCDFDSTVNLNVFSMINSTQDPPPLSGQTLDVPAQACPSIGVDIPDTPIELASIGVCNSFVFTGAPFRADISVTGGTLTSAGSNRDFDGTNPVIASVTPSGNPLTLTLNDFRYTPYLKYGIYFTFNISVVTVWSSPSITVTEGDFLAVTNPYPESGSGMRIATDGTRQPTSTSFTIPVAVPPVTTATLSPATPNGKNGWYKSNVTVTLNAQDKGSGVRSITYSATGGQVIPETTVNGATTTFTISGEGITTVTFFARENLAGVAETSRTVTIKLDKTAPSSTANLTFNAGGSSLAYTVTDPTPGSGPAGLHYRVFTISGSTDNFSAGATGTLNFNSDVAAVEYWGEDIAGNEEASHHFFGAVINNLDTNTPGTLRYLLNLVGDGATIYFRIAGPGPHTIKVLSLLPEVKQNNLTIDATSEPGTICGSELQIVLNGRRNIETGLNVTGKNVKIMGLTLNGFFGQSIWLNNTTGATLECNFIGTNASATRAANGSEEADVAAPIGLRINGGGTHTIGSTVAGRGNLIAGDIYTLAKVTNSPNNRFIGNIMGADRDGKKVIGDPIEGVRKNGTLLEKGSDNTVIEGNLLVGQVTANIRAVGVKNVKITNNVIGTDKGETKSLGQIIVEPGLNIGHIVLEGGSEGAIIRDNVLSNFNHTVILIADKGSDNAKIENNLIGINRAGKILAKQIAALDTVGIWLQNGPTNAQITGNTIVGIYTGIQFSGSGTNKNTVKGNFIGTSATGQRGMGNSYGVWIFEGASNNLVTENVIANGEEAVKIGTEPQDLAVGNTVSKNSMYGNARGGIVLANDNYGEGTLNGQAGMTNRDAARPNSSLISASFQGGNLVVTGKANAANFNSTVELFVSGGNQEFPQGKTFLGTVKANADGSFSLTVAAGSLTPGTKLVLSSTLTTGDTSAFGLEVNAR